MLQGDTTSPVGHARLRGLSVHQRPPRPPYHPRDAETRQVIGTNVTNLDTSGIFLKSL